MKKNLFRFTVLLVVTVITCNVFPVCAYGEETGQKKVINSTDWMAELPDDIRITSMNIPGVHDAAMAHSTATVLTENTLTQTYYIGNTTYEDKYFFEDNKVVTEPGLLEQGVRYFDIRFDYQGYDPTDEDDVAERDEYLSRFSEEEYPLVLMRFASEHLVLCHNVYNARYLVGDYYGWRDWEDVTNLKLMEWIGNFLTDHPNETVILDISAEDEDQDDKERIASVAYDFFHTLATYGGYGHFPEIYVGNHVPTLGECRGKIVVLTDMPYRYEDYFVFDPVTGEEEGHWAFQSGYSEGDAEEMTFALAKTDPYMNARVYKNNRYDGITKDIKWVYVHNGLDSAADFYALSKKDGYDPFMLLYCSENRFFKGTPKTFAKYINPKVNEYLLDQSDYRYYGIIVLDFANDTSVVDDDIVKNIYATNFKKDYGEYQIGEKIYDFSSYSLEYVNNAPKTGMVIGDGDPVIVIGGSVIVIGAVVTAIVIGKKRKAKKSSREA